MGTILTLEKKKLRRIGVFRRDSRAYILSQLPISVGLQACREKGVDCLVAPFEADAQLTYMLNQGFARFVITEDSDLIAFGCKRVSAVCGEKVLLDRARLKGKLRLKCIGYAVSCALLSGSSDPLWYNPWYVCLFISRRRSNSEDFHLHFRKLLQRCSVAQQERTAFSLLGNCRLIQDRPLEVQWTVKSHPLHTDLSTPRSHLHCAMVKHIWLR